MTIAGQAAELGHDCGRGARGAIAERLVDERSSPAWSTSKKNGLQAAAASGAGRARVGAEVAHRVLEAAGAPSSSTPSTSPSSTRSPPGSDARRRRRRRQPVGDLVEVAGVEAHVVAGAVGLDAGAVELPLDRRRAGRRRARRRRRRRATRASAGPGGSGSSSTAASPALPSVRATRAAVGERSGEHRRRADRGQRHTGRLGDGVGHHAVERALAQLAAEDGADHALLGLGRSAQQVAKHVAATGNRAAAADRSEGVDRVVDVVDAERGLGGGVRPDVGERRPADADPALERVAGGIGDGGFDLLRRRLAQDVRQCGDLLGRFEVAATVREASASSSNSTAPVWLTNDRARLAMDGIERRDRRRRGPMVAFGGPRSGR